MRKIIELLENSKLLENDLNFIKYKKEKLKKNLKELIKNMKNK